MLGITESKTGIASGRAGTGAGGLRRHRMQPCWKTGRKALLILKFFVFFSESLDAAGCVDQFLFTGEKRMALGADFHADVLFGGSNLNGIAAGTLDIRVLVSGMYVGFHCYFNPL